MNTIKRTFQGSLLPSELMVVRKIVAIITLPVMVFYMTSLNFLVAGLIEAKAQEITVEKIITPEAETPAVEKKTEVTPEVEEPTAPVIPVEEVKAEIPKIKESAVVNEEAKAEEALKVEVAPVFSAPADVFPPVVDEAPAQDSFNVTTDALPATPTVEATGPASAEKLVPQWNTDSKKATTSEAVQLNKTYVAPQNDQVTVTFTKLPASPGKLSIEEITLTAEQVSSLHALSNKAYDITSDMADGTFTYTMTLPKAENQKEVQIKFAEDIAGLKNAETVAKGDVKTETHSVSAELDHFTIFVVSSPVLTGPACIAGGASSDTNCYATIQEAITAAADGDTINVAAGTYIESGQIVINKGLTIAGAGKATTIIKTNQNTGSGGDAGAWFLVNSGKTFNLSNVTLDGTGYDVRQGIRSWGDITIDNSNFQNITYPGYMGWGVVFFGKGTVSNCEFTNMGRIGINSTGNNSTTALITNNIYHGKGAGDKLDYGIVVNYGATATITGNTISNIYGVASDSSTSSAIGITTGFGSGTHATINNNTISNASYGVSVVGNTANGNPTVTMSSNSITNVDQYAVESYVTSGASLPHVTAESNWWGSLDETVVATKISGDVDYLPFCTDSTCSATTNGIAPTGELLTLITTNHPTPGIKVTAPTAGVYTVTPALTGTDQLTSLTVVVTDDNLNKTAVPAYIDGSVTANGTMVWSSGDVWTWTPGSAVNFDEGAHYLTATFADDADNTTLLRVNFTTDRTAPVVTLLGDSPLDVVYGSTYTDAGATASDTLDGNITANIITVDPVNTATVGNYTVTYNVVDGAGNHAVEVTRIVHVIKADQTTLIAVATPAMVVYGNTSTLSTTGGNGTGAVTYNAGTSTGCSVSGTTLTVVNASGTCQVTATKATDANYNSATSAEITVTLSKANADCASIAGYDDVYDGSAHGASGTCEGVGSDGTLAGLNLGASFTDVPGGTANWNFADTTGNYNNVSGSVDISIGQTEPDEDGNATLNNSNPQVVLTDGEQAVTIKVTPGTEKPTIDVSAFLTDGTATLPEITINTEVAEVFIPAGAAITGPAGWDGVISAPTAGTPSGGNAPAGFAVGNTVITLGSVSGMLIFNPAVVITLPGVTGAVGYRPAGSNQWIEITNICTGTYDDPTGAPAGGECTINDETDTRILTYHFTSFGELLDTRAPETVDNFKGVYRPITGDVKLTWDVNDGDISEVSIYRGTTQHYTLNSHSRLNTQDRRDEDYTDTEITLGKTYYYKLVTKDEAGNKSDVKVIKITIPTAGETAFSEAQPTEPAPTETATQGEAVTGGGTDTSVTGEASGGDQGSATKGTVLGETTDQGSGNQQSGFWASNWKWFLALIFAGGAIFFWRRRRQAGGNIVG